MKILVTGANGYLGIIKKLLDDGIEVIAAGRNLCGVDARAQKIECDIFSIDNPYSYFDCPDTVLHLAWEDGFLHNANSHIINLPKHHKFLLELFNSDIKNVAVMGSMHEIGFYEGSIDEKSVCNPMNLYGIAKNALRQDVEYMARIHKKNYQWLRAYYIVGNLEKGSSIFSKIYNAAKQGIKEFPFTHGLNQYDFLEYDEFCRRVAITIEQDMVNGIINICSGRPEQLSYRVEKFIKENGLDIVLKYGLFSERPYDSKAIWGNDSKIEQILLKCNKKK